MDHLSWPSAIFFTVLVIMIGLVAMTALNRRPPQQ